MRRPSAVAALVALVALVLLGGPVAARAAPSAGTLARALERSPVYVDPAYAEVVPPAAQRRLARDARRAPGAVRVLLVPLITGDQYNGDSRDLVVAVRNRLPEGQRDGTFITIEHGSLRPYAYRADEPLYAGPAADAATLANYIDGPDGEASDRSLADRVQIFLAEIRRSPEQLAARVKAGEEAAAARRREAGYDDRRTTGGGGGGGGWIVAVLVLLAAGVGGLAWRRSRRGARAADAPLPVLPDRVFEHARAAQRADLAEDADRELLALAKALDDSPVPKRAPAQDAYQRALDAYTGARRRMQADAPVVDLVGVLVLVDDARRHLATAAGLDAGRSPGERTPLCFFHPLHGRASRTVAWGAGLQVPACSACAAAVRRGSDPDALRDGDQPYFEADTVWARTGFGAFRDDLIERIARGER